MVTPNLTKADFLGVTLDLSTGKYYTHRMPNADTVYRIRRRRIL